MAAFYLPLPAWVLSNDRAREVKGLEASIRLARSSNGSVDLLVFTEELFAGRFIQHAGMSGVTPVGVNEPWEMIRVAQQAKVAGAGHANIDAEPAGQSRWLIAIDEFIRYFQRGQP